MRKCVRGVAYRTHRSRLPHSDMAVFGRNCRMSTPLDRKSRLYFDAMSQVRVCSSKPRAFLPSETTLEFAGYLGRVLLSNLQLAEEGTKHRLVNNPEWLQDSING